MTFTLTVEKIQQAEAYCSWKKENPESYLCYGFTMLKEGSFSDWQIGFYNKENDMITTFINKEEGVDISPDQEIFKEPHAKVMELKTIDVKITLDHAMGIADSKREDDYAAISVIQVMAIIQNIEEYGTVWNITFISPALETLNLKISAENGSIVHENKSAFIDMQGHPEKK